MHRAVRRAGPEETPLTTGALLRGNPQQHLLRVGGQKVGFVKIHVCNVDFFPIDMNTQGGSEGEERAVVADADAVDQFRDLSGGLPELFAVDGGVRADGPAGRSVRAPGTGAASFI